MSRDCVHGSLARSCEVCELEAELDAARTGHRAAVRALSQALGERDRLADGIRELADARDRDAEASPARMFGGAPFPAIVTTGELRSLLDVAGDDPPVPYRALEGSEGGEDG